MMKEELIQYGASYDGVWSWALAEKQEGTSRTGKWMFWPKSEGAIPIWRTICELTRSHQLGIQAKMRVEKRDETDALLICVYTRDSEDVEDLQRIVDILREKVPPHYFLLYKEDTMKRRNADRRLCKWCVYPNQRTIHVDS
ncbi:putative phosphothreonine lyase domain-containg protein [Ktedonobacter racemifer]|nr:putative phosphothreonine lyase domain-containg protein [Ktedonobacter racemifer]